MQIVLFHSAIGFRPSIQRAADRLRTGGHDVVAPDLYDGVTFDDVAAGVAQMRSIGWGTLLERAQAAVPASGPVVLAGLSMGAGLAMTIAAERPDVRGVLLLHAGMPWEDRAWPAIPVQMHFAVADEWVDEGEPIKGVEQVARSGAPASMHVYPGSTHLFTDEDLSAEYDERSTELLWSRALAFLAELED